MSDQRLGVYLLPAEPLAAAVAAVHRRLAREHGLRAAGRFMPHVTLKGFFRTEAEPAELEARLRSALDGRPAVTLHNAGAVPLAGKRSCDATCSDCSRFGISRAAVIGMLSTASCGT